MQLYHTMVQCRKTLSSWLGCDGKGMISISKPRGSGLSDENMVLAGIMGDTTCWLIEQSFNRPTARLMTEHDSVGLCVINCIVLLQAAPVLCSFQRHMLEYYNQTNSVSSWQSCVNMRDTCTCCVARHKSFTQGMLRLQLT